MAEDIDVTVGYWLRDIPYIWKKLAPRYINHGMKEWEKYQRLYIIPFKLIKYLTEHPVEKISKLGYHYTYTFFKKNNTCSWSILRYFMVEHPNFDMTLEGGRINDIRINGYQLHLPLVYSEGELALGVDALYDYIGISIPEIIDIEKWNTRLLVKSDHQRPLPPFIRLSYPHVPETPTEGDKTYLTRGWLRELHITFWYLQHIGKYPGVCMPLTSGFESYVGVQGSRSLLIYPTADFSSYIIFDPGDQLKDMMKLCMKSPKIKRIFLQITWQYVWNKQAHANFLLIDKTIVNLDGSYNIYFFDPLGAPLYKDAFSLIPRVMASLTLGKTQGYKWTYHNTNDFCPSISFQKLESHRFKRIGDYEGFCGIWTIWVMELLMRNPNKPYNVVIRSALNKLAEHTPDFRQFIRRHAKTIELFGDEMRKKLSLEITDPDVKEPFTKEDLTKITNYIQKIRAEYLEWLQ